MLSDDGKIYISTTINYLNVQINLMTMAMHVKLYQRGANDTNIVIINYIHNANELTFISLFLKVTLSIVLR